jgi:hypothetical protein
MGLGKSVEFPNKGNNPHCHIICYAAYLSVESLSKSTSEFKHAKDSKTEDITSYISCIWSRFEY